MEILERLESSIETLLEQNRCLKAENASLQREKQQWQDDRSYLLGEIDRMLERIALVQLEDS